MTQLRQQRTRVAELGVQVAVVTFDDSVLARNYVQQTQLEWPLLLDVDRKLYRAYGMDRGYWWAIYGPASIWHYLKLIFVRGRRVERPGRDFRQMGGDVLIDPSGTIRFYHVSQSPHDRPDVDSILDCCVGMRVDEERS